MKDLLNIESYFFFEDVSRKAGFVIFMSLKYSEVNKHTQTGLSGFMSKQVDRYQR